MISPKLYQKSRTYDFFMKSFGYSRSIERFLSDLQLDLPDACRVLDAGCGTGILGLHFLQRYPKATLTSTDLEPNFLQATLANSAQHGIDPNRIKVGVSNISDPNQVKPLEGPAYELEAGAFDLICVGAVVGYADDTEESLRKLLSMLSPGGYLVNVEMNESPTGRYVSHRYHYHNIALDRMCQVIREAGCDVRAKKLAVKHLPAKLTRVGVIAHKPDASS